MATRKALSKKTRFEVLKRDRFACQYCGAKAPEALLHVDHIRPVAEGGTNDILNLVTSCESCNCGKGARQLSDESAVSASRAQAEELQTRKELIEMMAEWQNGLLDLQEQAVSLAADYYAKLVPGWNLSESGIATLRRHISIHGLEAVMSTMRTVLPRAVRIENGKVSEYSSGIATRQLFNTLKYKKQNDEDPIGSELKYIRGILRNRISYCPMGTVLNLLREAHESGVPMGELRDLALDAKTFTSWEYALQQLMRGE